MTAEASLQTTLSYNKSPEKTARDEEKYRHRYNAELAGCKVMYAKRREEFGWRYWREEEVPLDIYYSQCEIYYILP
tara:strand:- start:65 stop:292 length:228 start_codon:yes stop_codon:yes gene_type:complete